MGCVLQHSLAMSKETEVFFHAAFSTLNGILLPGLVSPVTHQLLIFTVVTQLALLSLPITFPDPLLRSSGDQSSFCTYYLPLPDQTARLSSDLFNFSECELCKTNILEHGY